MEFSSNLSSVIVSQNNGFVFDLSGADLDLLFPPLNFMEIIGGGGGRIGGGGGIPDEESNYSYV